MTRLFTTLLFLALFAKSNGQEISAFADSIRIRYKIPELAFAVVSADTLFEMQVAGVQRINTGFAAHPGDKFRIGSNTKAITGFLAALLVKNHQISWDTKFFELYPELKPGSDPAYHELTLLNLLTFRTRLFSYTYTYSEPTKEQFTGNEEEQRYQFTRWFFQQKPVNTKDSIHFSNLGYTAAALMLEKASGKSYQSLVSKLGTQLGINFGFGAPNSTDTLQPWGHDKDAMPEPPGENYKLNWLLAAGNIQVSLPDYAKFIRLQLQGLQGRSALLSKEEFYFLHYGLTRFSVGWFWLTDENNRTCSYNIGNPGTFLTMVYVYKDSDIAFIVFANSQSAETEEGMNVLLDALYSKYIGGTAE